MTLLVSFCIQLCIVMRHFLEWKKCCDVLCHSYVHDPASIYRIQYTSDPTGSRSELYPDTLYPVGFRSGSGACTHSVYATERQWYTIRREALWRSFECQHRHADIWIIQSSRLAQHQQPHLFGPVHYAATAAAPTSGNHQSFDLWMVSAYIVTEAPDNRPRYIMHSDSAEDEV